MTEPEPPEPNGGYLDRLMRRDSFEALWPLFAKATKPAKELTESFSALEHLRPFLSGPEPCRVIHVGDGAHARTAAMFALKTTADNISVDPLINLQLVRSWQLQFGVERLSVRKAPIEEVVEELNALPPMRVLVTFVHAHVAVDRILDRLKWHAAYSLACCLPGKQLSTSRSPHLAGHDLGVLCTGRQFQVLVNQRQLNQRPVQL
jgi:hypothetical protein